MTQKTDIHYFAFGREGKFNWRFVYPFDYDPITKRIVYKEKVKLIITFTKLVDHA